MVGDDSHDIGLARGHVHLRKDAAAEKQCDSHPGTGHEGDEQ